MTKAEQLVLMLIFVAVMLPGCATVKPWEREYLADEAMYFDPDPLETGWHLHLEEVLEGSRGGYSGTGGGCGCR
ncbi:MAG: DUF4266 domain-containing protein [Nitrospiria bacterium]